MTSVAPKTDAPLLESGEDEEDMTSIMSADQRKLLQHAAAKEAEALERDTARPPPSLETAAVPIAALPAIPKAPALPRLEEARKRSAPPAEAAAPPVATPSGRTPGAPPALWPVVVPFLLLAAAVVFALR